MYGVAGGKRPNFLESDAFLYNLDDPTYRRYYFKIMERRGSYTSSYIIIPPGGIIMYGLAGGTIFVITCSTLLTSTYIYVNKNTFNQVFWSLVPCTHF
jgi:hypothetical protein